MKILLTLLLFAFCNIASAQAVSTSVNFDKTTKPALMLYLPYDVEVAEGTILTKLKEIGYQPETKGSLFWKQNKVNDFYAFKGVNLQGEMVDLYFKVDRRGKKKDAQSVMYLLTSKGGDSFVTSSDASTYTHAQNFLNSFVGETATYKHTLDVQAQEETVKKAEKRLTDLISEENDLSKKIAKLQEDLRKNKEDQAKQQMTIEAERRKLEEMRQVKQ